MWTLLLVLACTPKQPPTVAAVHVVEPEPESELKTVDLALRHDDILLVTPYEPRARVLQFSDWQCPHCSAASPEVLALVRDLGDVELRFRTFPLSAGCTPLEMAHEAPERCELARLALCAHAEGRFEEFLAVGFQGAPYAFSLPEWSTPSLVSCRESEATQALVLAHAQTGVDAGLMGTPSFYVETDGEWYEVSGPAGVAELLATVE